MAVAEAVVIDLVNSPDDADADPDADPAAALMPHSSPGSRAYVLPESVVVVVDAAAAGDEDSPLGVKFSNTLGAYTLPPPPLVAFQGCL